MTTLYRILTEDKGGPARATVNDIVGRFFDGFTTIRARGYWKGVGEKSYIVEIHATATYADELKVKAAADQIKRALQQDAVLVQKFDCVGTLI